MRGGILGVVALLVSIVGIDLAVAQSASLEQARQARFAGRIDEADRLLGQILTRDPSNYLALYNMGLVYEARAVRARPGEPRLKHYRTAANWLERAYKSPGRANAGADTYTIYNSLGAMYLGLGDLQKSRTIPAARVAEFQAVERFFKGSPLRQSGLLLFVAR